MLDLAREDRRVAAESSESTDSCLIDRASSRLSLGAVVGGVEAVYSWELSGAPSATLMQDCVDADEADGERVRPFLFAMAVVC